MSLLEDEDRDDGPAAAADRAARRQAVMFAAVALPLLLASGVFACWRAGLWPRSPAPSAGTSFVSGAQVIAQAAAQQQSGERQLASEIASVQSLTRQMARAAAPQRALDEVHRFGVAQQACYQASLLPPGPRPVAAWVSANCAPDGAVLPSSPLQIQDLGGTT